MECSRKKKGYIQSVWIYKAKMKNVFGSFSTDFLYDKLLKKLYFVFKHIVRLDDDHNTTYKTVLFEKLPFT